MVENGERVIKNFFFFPLQNNIQQKSIKMLNTSVPICLIVVCGQIIIINITDAFVQLSLMLPLACYRIQMSTIYPCGMPLRDCSSCLFLNSF